MTNSSIAPLISSLLFLSLGCFVFLKSREIKSIKITFFLICFVTFWWQFTWFILFNTYSVLFASLLVRIGYMGITLIPVSFFHFYSNYIKNKESKPWIILYYFIASIFIILLWTTDLYIDNFYNYSWGFYPKAGILHPLYLTYLVIVILHCINSLVVSGKSNNWIGNKSDQIKYLILSFFIYCLACSDFITNYGYDFYPIGFFFILICLIIISSAITKHRLMDINIIFKKGIIYSISIATISIFYLLSIFILEGIAQTIFDYKSLIISISTAFVLGLVFMPIRYKIQYFLDQYFFKGSTEEIANQNEQLRQEIIHAEKYKTLTTLATGIAHEIKNPLTAIKTFSEYLPSKLDDKVFLTKFANIVGREVDRINDMTHQLLDYGKPAPLALKKTNIYKLIDNTIDILNSKFVGQKIKIVKRLKADQSLILNIDPNQLRQALLNIFLNAIEAMPKGGVLTVSTLVTPMSYYAIKIEDTGVGIAREDLSQVFDPFFSKKDDGTGLGLSITQSLIENHKGIVQIKSRVGTGTSVRIDLPC